MGATSRILIELMRFGIWRSGRGTWSMTEFEAQKPRIAGGNRLQWAVQGKRAPQRFSAAARRQSKSNAAARERHHAHVGNERQRFQIGLRARVVPKVGDA